MLSVHCLLQGMFDPIPDLYSKRFSDLASLLFLLLFLLLLLLLSLLLFTYPDFISQVTSMLQVDPKDRPSAEELLVSKLPPLMVQFMEDVSDFIPSEAERDQGMANTR